MKNQIKNISIIALVMIAVLQTSQLWFGVTLNHNFFYSLKNVFWAADKDYNEKIFFASPYRLIAKVANNTYKIRYNELSINIAKQNGDQLLKDLLQNGSFVAESDLNWVDVLRRNCIIYEYKFVMEASVFANCFSVKSSVLTTKVPGFDNIVIVPAKSATNAATVYFVDSVNGKSYEFTVKTKRAANENLWMYIEDTDTGRLNYISSAENDQRNSRYNTFIPDFPNSGFRFYMAVRVNPYAINGVLELNKVSQEVDVFFDNPIMKIADSDTENKLYRYTDGASVVVRYYENNMLHYSNFKTDSKASHEGLIANYSAAVNFINTDTHVINDYYLSHYTHTYDEATKSGSYTFYFDYAVLDFPIVMSTGTKNETGLEHMLEITVVNQRVTNYKKLVFNFIPDETDQNIATINYYDFLDSLFEAGTNDEARESMGEASLVYAFDILDRKLYMPLNWYTVINSKTWISPVNPNNTLRIAFLTPHKEE